MKYQGFIVTTKDTFGFIFSQELGRRVFYHVGSVNGANPILGDRVEFELAASRTPGKPDAAVNIVPFGGV